TQHTAIVRVHDRNTPAVDRIHKLAVDEQSRFDVEFGGYFYTGCHSKYSLYKCRYQKIMRGAAFPQANLRPALECLKTLLGKAAARPRNSAWAANRHCFPKP